MDSKTLTYISKRYVLAVITIWVVITIAFFVMHLIPGGLFLAEKPISAAATAVLEAKYRLDKPVFQQYLTYLKDRTTKLDVGPPLKQRNRRPSSYRYYSRWDEGIGKARSYSGFFRRYFWHSTRFYSSPAA